MRITKYPVKIKGELYTAELKVSPCEYDMVMIQINLYRGVQKIYRKPEFALRKRVPIDTYIREAEHEMELLEGAHEDRK